jgi:hypothetical protein
LTVTSRLIEAGEASFGCASAELQLRRELSEMYQQPGVQSAAQQVPQQ